MPSRYSGLFGSGIRVRSSLGFKLRTPGAEGVYVITAGKAVELVGDNNLALAGSEAEAAACRKTAD